MLVLLVALLVGASPLPLSAAPGPSAAPWVSAPPTVHDSLATYYARRDTSAVDRLYRNKARTREEQLLCLYRLYPMTLDTHYLADIPSTEGVRSARELALISALWAYRASSGPAWRLPIDGRRSERVLNDALALDPDEPYALLVEGQALLYKPRMFGGDVAEARRTFERLRQVLGRRPAPGIHPFEVEIWIWMAVRKQDPEAGTALRRRLLAQNPPPMFRQFLLSPP